MKKQKLLLIIAFTAFLIKSNAQELIISNPDGFIKYDSKEKKTTTLNEHKFISQTNPQRIIYIDQLAYEKEQISNQLLKKQGFDFFQGLQSPYDSNLWIYMERQEIGGSYNVKSFNTNSNKINSLLKVKNDSREKMAYKPIAWTNNPDEIFVEGLYLDSAEEHEGIFIINIKNKKISKVNVPFQYMRTPILGHDRTTFYFVGTQDEKMNILHGNTDIVYEFNINSKKTTVVHKQKGALLIINGWKDTIETKSKTVNQARISSIDYYLPWDFNKDLCVSRHGTPAPSGLNNNVGICGWFSPGGQHGYAAVDFATSQNSNDNVRAAASGTVSFAGISGSLSSGYGRLVIITHSDGTRTYYAHNSSILVSQGQSVSQGQVIAREGTTGGSTGDHIHFEWRAAGGNTPTIGSFKDIGQPRVDNRYRSNNSTTPNNVPVPVSPANGATNLLLPINFTYTSPVNAGAFRIQVSTSNSGWTATNGFTTNTAPNATVLVNASITTNNYYWNETAAGSLEGPKAGKTYYYTIRSWDATTGTSQYSAVRTISTAFGAQPIAPTNAATVNSPANLSWTSNVSGASYRLQISKVNSGWTAENGFTTDASPTANVPVNYSAAGLVNYTWPNQYTAAANFPTSGNTYYWTVRLWSSATGSSKYTPVRSFTINGNSLKVSENNSDVLIYPNPTNGEINISFESKTQNAEINIYDISGNNIFSKKYNSEKGKITINENISDLKSGNYILLLNDGEKVISKNISVKN